MNEARAEGRGGACRLRIVPGRDQADEADVAASPSAAPGSRGPRREAGAGGRWYGGAQWAGRATGGTRPLAATPAAHGGMAMAGRVVEAAPRLEPAQVAELPQPAGATRRTT